MTPPTWQEKYLNIKLLASKGEWGRDKLGIYDQNTTNIHTTIYKIDKQQGPTVQHRKLNSIFYNKL